MHVCFLYSPFLSFVCFVLFCFLFFVCLLVCLFIFCEVITLLLLLCNLSLLLYICNYLCFYGLTFCSIILLQFNNIISLYIIQCYLFILCCDVFIYLSIHALCCPDNYNICLLFAFLFVCLHIIMGLGRVHLIYVCSHVYVQFLMCLNVDIFVQFCVYFTIHLCSLCKYNVLLFISFVLLFLSFLICLFIDPYLFFC